MQKTASQISDEVLAKLAKVVAGRLPLSFLNTVGKANKNPADMALRASKIQALREAPDHARELERSLRKAPMKDPSKFSRSSGPLFNKGWGPTQTPMRREKDLSVFGGAL